MGAPVDCNTFTPGNLLGKGTHCNVCLSTGQVLGLAFGAQAGLASLLAVLMLFVIVARRYYQNIKSPPEAPWRLLRSNLDALLLNLLVAEIPMSVGGIMDAQWANERQVYCGSSCNLQGALQFIGETAVAMFTLAIALHTFISIWMNRRLRYHPLFWITYSVCVWVYVFLFALICWASHKDEAERKGFFAPTPFWCWINSRYAQERFGEYFWLWVAGVGNLILYTILAFLLCGCFAERDEEATEERKELRREAWLQLLNPLGYTILVLPPSIFRWMFISRHNPPSVLDSNMTQLATATLIFHVTFRLSGLINVLLVLTTRSGLLLINSTGELHPSDLRRQREEKITEFELHRIELNSRRNTSCASLSKAPLNISPRGFEESGNGPSGQSV